MQLNEYIVSYLNKLGINYIFGVGGANIEDMYDACFYSKKIEAILCKHETSACCAAEGYSRAKKNMGVVMSTSGGAMLNLAPSLGEAYTSNIPILAIIGQPNSSQHGIGAFQDTSGISSTIDALEFFKSITKLSIKLEDPSDIYRALYELVTAALTPPRGPVAILIPKDFQSSSIDAFSSYAMQLPNLKNNILEDKEYALNTFLKRIKNDDFSNAVIVLGSELMYLDNIDPIYRFIEIANIRKVLLSAPALPLFPNNDKRFLGVIGIMGHDFLSEEIESAESMIFVGAQLDILERLNIEKIISKKKCIFINEALPYPKYYKLKNKDSLFWIGNPNQLFEEFNICVSQQKSNCSIDIKNRDEVSSVKRNDQCYSFVNDPTIVKANKKDYFLKISELLEDNINVVVDAGNTGAFAMHYISCPKDSCFHIPLGMGTMGHSFGIGIGMCFANKKRTYVLAGDGSFLMLGLEIHTAIEYSIPVTFIIFNNNSHGMCYTREKLFYSGEYSYNKFKHSNYAEGVKRMFPSVLAFNIKTISDLDASLNEIKSVHPNAPAFISIDVDVEEVPPFSSFIQKYLTLA